MGTRMVAGYVLTCGECGARRIERETTYCEACGKIVCRDNEECGETSTIPLNNGVETWTDTVAFCRACIEQGEEEAEDLKSCGLL